MHMNKCIYMFALQEYITNQYKQMYILYVCTVYIFTFLEYKTHTTYLASHTSQRDRPQSVLWMGNNPALSTWFFHFLHMSGSPDYSESDTEHLSQEKRHKKKESDVLSCSLTISNMLHALIAPDKSYKRCSILIPDASVSLTQPIALQQGSSSQRLSHSKNLITGVTLQKTVNYKP